jgi:hypothetical protein
MSTALGGMNQSKQIEKGPSGGRLKYIRLSKEHLSACFHALA